MKPINIDFAPAPRRTYGLDGALLGIGLAVSGATTWAYMSLDASNEILSDRKASLRRQIERTQAILATESGAMGHSDYSNAARPGPTRKGWTLILGAIESSVDETVTLLSLRVGENRNGIEALAEAKDSVAMFAFIGRLTQQGGLKQIVLRHHEVAIDHPHKPVRFSMSARLHEDHGGD